VACAAVLLTSATAAAQQERAPGSGSPPDSEARQDGSSSENDRRARAHFQAGALHYDRGHYEQAVEQFKAAYELSGRAELLYNIYTTQERLGRYAAAAETLSRYLKEGDRLENRDSLEARLERLRRRAEKKGKDEAEATRSKTRGDSERPGVTGPGRGVLPVAAWVSFGVGAAGLVSFAIAGGMALGEDASVADRCGSDAGRICTDDQVSRLQRLTRTADAGLGLGLAGVVTGVLLTVLLDGADRESQSGGRVAVAPWTGPRGGGATIRVSF
jgi:tetratricopeptide (TPR) repeat protein